VDIAEPWTLARQRKQGDASAGVKLGTILYNLAESLRLIAYYCQPFLPDTAQAIAQQLNVSLNGDWSDLSQWGGYVAGTAVQPGGVLFPKLDG
jgi:methionyl-tRNA synthetase